MNALDLKITGGKTIAEVALAPLLEQGVEITVVDAGAKGGMNDLPARYAAHAHYHGFEPNQPEFDKLTSHTTDTVKAGYAPPKWRQETIRDSALWNAPGRRPLYIMSYASGSTMMGEVKPELVDRMFFDWGGRGGVDIATLGDTGVELRGIEEVKCECLDDIISAETTIDYFKLDVEGGESKVFEGAKSLLESRKILFIKTEFMCVPVYQDHQLLGHQHATLDGYGFRLLDVVFQHLRYMRCRSRIPKAVERGLVFAGDAFFALDPDQAQLSKLELHRMGLIALAHGFRSFGLSLFRDAAFLDSEKLHAIEDALAHVPLRRRLRLAWEQFPHNFAQFIYTRKWPKTSYQWR